MINKYQLGQKVKYKEEDNLKEGVITVIKMPTKRENQRPYYRAMIDPAGTPSYKFLGQHNFVLEKNIIEIIKS